MYGISRTNHVILFILSNMLIQPAHHQFRLPKSVAFQCIGHIVGQAVGRSFRGLDIAYPDHVSAGAAA